MNSALNCLSEPATGSELSLFSKGSNHSREHFDRLMKQMIHSPGRMIQFEIASKQESQVFVAGTFNDWDTTSHPLTYHPEDGLFKGILRLLPGTYHYKFIVDGVWRIDDKCSRWVINPHGSLDSVLEIDDSTREQQFNPPSVTLKNKGNAEMTIKAKSPFTRAKASKAAKLSRTARAPAPKLEPTTKRITFCVRTNPGSHVFLAGTFNNWDPTAKEMTDKKGNGVYITTLMLPAGIHEYKFVIDGIWYADTGCSEFVQNEYGTHNSVKRIG